MLPVSKVRIQTRIHQTCSLSAKFTRIERRLHFVAFNESHENSHTTRHATFPFYTRSANGLDTHCHFRLAFSRKAAILRYPFVAAAAKRPTREGTVLSTDSVSFVRPKRLLLLTNASFHTQNSKGTHVHTKTHKYTYIPRIYNYERTYVCIYIRHVHANTPIRLIGSAHARYTGVHTLIRRIFF